MLGSRSRDSRDHRPERTASSGSASIDALINRVLADADIQKDVVSVLMLALEHSSTPLAEQKVVAREVWRDFVLEVDPSLQHVGLEKVVSDATGQVAWVAPSNVDAWQRAQQGAGA